MTALLDYFSTNNFMPHGHCYLWRPGILWLHVASDAMIALSYFSIPIMLYYFIYKKRDVPYKWLFKLFALFIFWCGMTHLVAIWTVWDPIYQIQGITKAITATISFMTALFLIPTIPKILSLRSPKDLEELNTKLENALKQKNEAEQMLTVANIELENQVAKRTAELTKYSDKLKVANSELESFANQASHDLKSPINTAMALLEELNQSPNDLSKYQLFIPKVQSNLKRLSSLITDLLDLSKLGENETTKEWLNLEEIMEDVRANVSYLVEENQARIYVDALFDVYANKTQLTAVLQNIIENAIKYTDDKTQPEILLSAQQKNDYWQIEIKDNGIGIDPSEHNNIFKPFYRLHTEDEFPGTGLGLSICKKIIINHGGTMELESKPEQGTTFRFTLPKF